MGKLRRNRLCAVSDTAHVRDSGQSLLELIIALGVFAVGVATIGFLVLDVNVASRQGLERAQATLLAKEGLEAARSIRDASFDNLVNGLHGIMLSGNTWVFSGVSDIQNQFTREIAVSSVPGVLDDGSDIKKVKSAVSWPITETRQGSVSFIDYLTDWNQTQGDAGELSVDISSSILMGGAAKRVDGTTIENISSIVGEDIIISRMTLWWDTPDTIHRIRIDTTNVFEVPPPSGEPSGTEIDITDFTITQGSGTHDLELRFDGSVSGTDIIIKFIMSDGSTKYILLDL